jgi:2-polyprenyl-3-methyl-5-hydroxy-6-metoxy-1,4-benzoquinol methylase
MNPARMRRTPEPELMNDADQAAAYASADWSESHGKLPGYFQQRFPTFHGGRMIDLGCGPADISIRFARAFPDATIVGVDASGAMLEFGRRHIAQAGLESRITLEKRLLPDPAMATRSFDAVVCNSLLHHIADPLTLWGTVKACAKPGSPVFVVDLLRPSDEETAIRLVDRHAADAPSVLRRDFLASLHAAYTLDEVRGQLVKAGLADFALDQTDELHFIAWGFA